MRRYTSEIEREISHYQSYNLIYLNEVYTNPTTTPTKDHAQRIVSIYKETYKEWIGEDIRAYIESIAVRKVAKRARRKNELSKIYTRSVIEGLEGSIVSISTKELIKETERVYIKNR